MVTDLASQFSLRFGKLVAWLKGFEESGTIAIDSIAVNTREQLKDVGAL